MPSTVSISISPKTSGKSQKFACTAVIGRSAKCLWAASMAAGSRSSEIIRPPGCTRSANARLCPPPPNVPSTITAPGIGDSPARISASITGVCMEVGTDMVPSYSRRRQSGRSHPEKHQPRPQSVRPGLRVRGSPLEKAAGGISARGTPEKSVLRFRVNASASEVNATAPVCGQGLPAAASSRLRTRVVGRCLACQLLSSWKVGFAPPRNADSAISSKWACFSAT